MIDSDCSFQLKIVRRVFALILYLEDIENDNVQLRTYYITPQTSWLRSTQKISNIDSPQSAY